MSADVIDLTTRGEFKTAVDDLERMERAFNLTRDTFSRFSSHDRITLLGQLVASECCSYGDRNACRGLALKQFGEFTGEVVSEINRVFPPLEEGFR